MHFPFIHLKIDIKAIDNIRLPLYTGSALRGLFGASFKKIICSDYNKECKKCLLKDSCAYSYIFETTVPQNSKIMKKYEHIPKPFVLSPPIIKGGIIQEKSIQAFNMTIIGRAIDFLPYFIYTLISLGKNGIGKDRSRFIIDNIKLINGISSNKIIYNDGDEKINFSRSDIDKDFIINKTNPFNNKDQISLNFLTPLKIVYNENYLQPEDLDFHNIIRVLLRRVYLLSIFHTKAQLNIDFSNLINKAEKIKKETAELYWYNIRRHSSRQKKFLNIGGIKGYALFKGDFQSFLQYLILGSYLNIGKGTTFGLGKYSIKAI